MEQKRKQFRRNVEEWANIKRETIINAWKKAFP